MTEEAAHDVYQHKDGTTCIWDGNCWFVPLDAGGEGYICEKEHKAIVTCILKQQINKPTEAQVFRYGKLVFEGVDKSVLLEERRTTTADQLAKKHWLTFEYSKYYKREVIVGCHCGFKADVESDAGWGDSVVDHLLEVGRNG